MKCSICGEEATFSIPHYSNIKTKLIDFYEYRCNKHITLKRLEERKLNTARRKGVLIEEIDLLFPKPIEISKPSMI
jgi:hypothetical protein